jgi:hypothetical protein
MTTMTSTTLFRATPDAALIAMVGRELPRHATSVERVERRGGFRVTVSPIIQLRDGGRAVHVVVFPDEAQDDTRPTTTPALRERFEGPRCGDGLAALCREIGADVGTDVCAWQWNGMALERFRASND